MDLGIPLAEIASTSGTSSNDPSGTYNPSHNGSKGTSQRPLRSVQFQDGDLNGQEVDSKVGIHFDSRSAFTESTFVPRRNLGFIQVTSLMLNGCLGNSFFFTTPGYVLALVRSKRISLILYAVGAVYSALGMTVFLEYGIALPFNGGPLVYVSKNGKTAIISHDIWLITMAARRSVPCPKIAGNPYFCAVVGSICIDSVKCKECRTEYTLTGGSQASNGHRRWLDSVYFSGGTNRSLPHALFCASLYFYPQHLVCLV